mmetsp:Transcript_29418/g.64328  ORF Transcript_29418/g.64328 Transcript_29418/m.64328 type:complete len:207 (-) Transcript_29418:122-742(-)
MVAVAPTQDAWRTLGQLSHRGALQNAAHEVLPLSIAIRNPSRDCAKVAATAEGRGQPCCGELGKGEDAATVGGILYAMHCLDLRTRAASTALLTRQSAVDVEQAQARSTGLVVLCHLFSPIRIPCLIARFRNLCCGVITRLCLFNRVGGGQGNAVCALMPLPLQAQLAQGDAALSALGTLDSEASIVRVEGRGQLLGLNIDSGRWQ